MSVARRYPYTTGIQAWNVTLASLIDAAREQLDPVEYAWLIDLLATKVPHEAARELPEAA